MLEIGGAAYTQVFTVREFLKKSGKFFYIVKAREKSGNLWVKSNALCKKSRKKQKEVEDEKKNINRL